MPAEAKGDQGVSRRGLERIEPPRPPQDRGPRRGRRRRAARPAGRRPAQDGRPQPDAEPRVDRKPRGPVGRLRALEPVLDRVEPPERPGHPLRAPGVLQRLRRQGAPLAGGELPVQPRLQGADDQDPVRHQVERRRPLLGRGRRLHADEPPGPGPEGPLGGRRPAVHAGGARDRRQHGRDQVQGPRAPVLLLPDLQVRHRRLHRAEARLPGAGLDHVQALRRRQGLAGHHRTVAGGLLVAPAEGDRPPGRVVGGQGGPGADAEGGAQHLAAQRHRAAERPAADLEPDRLRGVDAAGDVPDDLPAEPEDHHALRAEAALRLHGLVADLALRQQRAPALRRQGRALGAQLLHRPAADRGRRVPGGVDRVAAAAARVPGAQALHRRGQGHPRQAQHARVQPQEGRGAPDAGRAGRRTPRASGSTPRATGSRSTSSASGRAGPRSAPCSWSSSSGRGSTPA